jgi:hypothetical protein
MSDNKWVGLLAYVTGLVNQELLLQNEYLIAESDFEGASATGLSDGERTTLAEIGKRLVWAAACALSPSARILHLRAP